MCRKRWTRSSTWPLRTAPQRKPGLEDPSTRRRVCRRVDLPSLEPGFQYAGARDLIALPGIGTGDGPRDVDERLRIVGFDRCFRTGRQDATPRLSSVGGTAIGLPSCSPSGRAMASMRPVMPTLLSFWGSRFGALATSSISVD